MKKKVLITGLTGQDGAYLAKFLLEKDYDVHGIMRRASVFTTKRLEMLDILDKINIHYGDATDSLSLDDIVFKVKPDEIYNLMAQSFVKASFSVPLYTGQVDALGTLSLLAAVHKHCPECKFYNATTSELFGLVQETPQTETTKFHPRSPYGVAKLYSFWIAKNYRESYNMFICNGILFNHESELRGSTFISKKITEAFVRMSLGKQDVLKLGNLNAKRDFGYAPDYIYAMWLMLQHNEPDDYVVSTNETHSVREFVEEAAPYVGYDIEWIGVGLDEKGIDKKTGKVIVEIDEKYFRPAEVDILLGDHSKITSILGWEPKVKFKELVKIMMEHDISTGGASI